MRWRRRAGSSIATRGCRAILQAQNTQELLAKQTGLGVANYYESVTGVLNLLQPPEGEERRPAPRRQADRQARRRHLEAGPLAPVTVVGIRIWHSIQDKANLLFIVDADDEMQVLRLLGQSEGADSPTDVVNSGRAWFEKVQTCAVSSFVTLPKSGGAHLVCVPLRGPDRLLMVAVVPMSLLECDVLQYVNRSATTGAMLVDDLGTFDLRAEQAGRRRAQRLSDADETHARCSPTSTSRRSSAAPRCSTAGRRSADVWLKPGMTTIEPVEVLGRTWFAVVSSDLTEVDNVIKPVFKDVLAWAMRRRDHRHGAGRLDNVSAHSQSGATGANEA